MNLIAYGVGTRMHHIVIRDGGICRSKWYQHAASGEICQIL